MRVLHLFSNHKWTGPAEPALNLCVALRTMGVRADFACAPDAGASVNKVVETARARGVDPVLHFYLCKHRRPIRNWRDRRALRAYLRDQRYDLVHCHLDNDHQIAARPAYALRVPLIRSSYHGEGMPVTRRHRWLLRHTSRLIAPGAAAADRDAAAFGFPRENIHVVPGAVDTSRFDPERALPDGRAWLKVPRDAFLLGIVARMQPHRRYEDLFEAMRLLLRRHPNAHLAVIGRGTRQEQVGFTPVRRLGLDAHVHFTGYIDGDNYAGMLKALDAGVFLVPGSDGTCRAVREMMAMGAPVVAARRGMLPEIAGHEREGLIVEGSAESLFEAFARLCEDPAFRARLGAAARERARTDYALAVQARRVLQIYKAALGHQF